MREQDHGSLPDVGLQQLELQLHGSPPLWAEGGGDGQHQQQDIRLWLTEAQTSAQLLGHLGRAGGVGRPPWSVHHRHLGEQIQ